MKTIQVWDSIKQQWQDTPMTEAEFREKFPWLRPGYMPLNTQFKPDDK